MKIDPSSIKPSSSPTLYDFELILEKYIAKLAEQIVADEMKESRSSICSQNPSRRASHVQKNLPKRYVETNGSLALADPGNVISCLASGSVHDVQKCIEQLSCITYSSHDSQLSASEARTLATTCKEECIATNCQSESPNRQCTIATIHFDDLKQGIVKQDKEDMDVPNSGSGYFMQTTIAENEGECVVIDNTGNDESLMFVITQNPEESDTQELSNHSDMEDADNDPHWDDNEPLAISADFHASGPANIQGGSITTGEEETKEIPIKIKQNSDEYGGICGIKERRKTETFSRTSIIQFHKYVCFWCSNKKPFKSWSSLGQHIKKAHFTKCADGRFMIECKLCAKAFFLTSPNIRIPAGSLFLLRKRIGDILVHQHSKHKRKFPRCVKTLPCPIKGCGFSHVLDENLRIHQKKKHFINAQVCSDRLEKTLVKNELVCPKYEDGTGKQVPEGAFSNESSELSDNDGDPHLHDNEQPDALDSDSDPDWQPKQKRANAKGSLIRLSLASQRESQNTIETDNINDISSITNSKSCDIRYIEEKMTIAVYSRGAVFQFHNYECFWCPHKEKFNSWPSLGKHIMLTHFRKFPSGCFKMKCKLCNKVFTLALNKRNVSSPDMLKMIRNQLGVILQHYHHKHKRHYPKNVEPLTCHYEGCGFTHLIGAAVNKHQRTGHATGLKKAGSKCKKASSTSTPVCAEITDCVEVDVQENGPQDFSLDKPKEASPNIANSKNSAKGTLNKCAGKAKNDQDSQLSNITEEVCHQDNQVPATASEITDETGSVTACDKEEASTSRKVTKPANRSHQGVKALSFKEYRCFLCPDEPSFKAWRQLGKHICMKHSFQGPGGKWQINCPNSTCVRKFSIHVRKKTPQVSLSDISRTLPRVLQHMNREHDFGFPHYVGVFHCEVECCDYSHITQYFIYEHFRTRHKEEEMMPCDGCGKMMKERKISRHKSNGHCVGSMKYNDPTLRLPCPHCDTTFKTKSNLTTHVKIKHKNDFRTYICEICSYPSRDPNALGQHMFKKHNYNPTGKRVFKCKHCDYSGIWERPYQAHVKRHSTKVTRICNECGETFTNSRSSAYLLHIETHSSNVYQCSQCSYSTKHKLYFQRHTMAQHLKTHMFPCKYCTYKSGYNENTLKHMKSCAKKHGIQ